MLVLAAIVVAALVGFFPHLRHFIWIGMFWGIVTVSVIVVVGAVINILSVMFSMYIGYRPTIVESRDAAGAPAGMPGEVLPFQPPSGDGEAVAPSNRLADAMVELRRAECALCNLASSEAFQAFGDRQKHQCYQALEDVQAMIQEMSKDAVHEQVAS
jgi:hypothetical protein